jgi:hypothetical protein
MVSKRTLAIIKSEQMQELATLAKPVKKIRKRKRVVVQSGYSFAKPVTAPIAGGIIVGKSYPRITTNLMSTIVSNTELATNVGTSAAFNANQYSLVPSSFTWLNGIAVNYSKWKWVSLRFLYIPYCPTTTAGQFSMAIEYDYTDTVATTEAQLSAMYGYVSSPTWAGWEGSELLSMVRKAPCAGSVVCTIDTNRFPERFYPYKTATLFGALTATDKLLYGPGQLNYSSNNGPTVSVGAGNLYAQYVIELIEPIAAALNN